MFANAEQIVGEPVGLLARRAPPDHCVRKATQILH